MATYHFTVKDKPKGYATSHFFYIARLEMYAGIRDKKNEAQEVLELVKLDGCMPSWATTPSDFWRAADTYERANAKVYMEYEFALPNELSLEQRKSLVETFVHDNVARHQYPHSYAIHNVKSRIDGIDQPHCHLMFSLRADDELERSAEQYFKRYNAKEPSKGGVRKKQLQEGFENFSAFLLDIRKKWENTLNAALEKYAPTVTYEVNGQSIELLNRVSASSYEDYNLKHGTLYIAEPKLGVGKQNETQEYLEKIKAIREHNAQEHLLEIKQQEKELRAEPYHLYSVNDQIYSTKEIDYLTSEFLMKDDKVEYQDIRDIRVQQQKVEGIYSGKNQEKNPSIKHNIKPKNDPGFSM